MPISIRLSAALLILLPIIARSQDDSLQTVHAPDVIVTALRRPIMAVNVPYAISIARLPGGMPGVSLDELLSSVPGVQVDNRFNNAVGERITIRGFGARTQFGVRGVRVVLDGLPMTFADGQSALEGIETPSVTQAEVFRGPASTLYGNASGGVILLRSNPPSTLPFELDLSLMGTSNEMLRGMARASGTSGSLAYGATFSATDDKGYRQHSASSSQRGSAIAEYAVDDGSRLSFGAGWTMFDAENPGSLTREMADADPRQAFTTNVAQKTGKSGEQFQLSAGWNRQDDGGGGRVLAHMILRSITNPIPDRIIELGRSAGGLRATANGRLDFADAGLEWNTGIDVDVQIDDRQNYRNTAGERGALIVDQDETVLAAGPWLQLMLPLNDHLVATGSLRYDHVRFSVVDHRIDSADPDDSGNRTMEALSPSLGLLWRPGTITSFYANMATAFETPTTTELANRPDGAGGFNPALAPQRTLSFEAGVRGTALSTIRYSLALYNATVADALVPFQVPDVPGRDFYRNVGSAVHRGAELALSMLPVRNTVLSLAYAYTDARFGSDQAEGMELEGNFLPGVARNRLSADFAWLPAGFLQLRLHGAASSEEFGDDANTVAIPGHFLLNVSAGFPLHSLFGSDDMPRYRIGLTAGVDNLLDKRYISSTTINAFGKRYFEPGAGRMVYLRIDGAVW